MAQTVADALVSEHDVTVLCGRPSYDPTERHPWRLWQTALNGRLEVVRVGSTDYSRVQMERRVLNYLSYVLLAVLRALFLPCDVILAMTDPPFAGIVGAFVAMLKQKPYVYNIRDMYPDMAVGGSIVEPGILSRIWEKLHRWALRRAQRVVVLGEDMRQRILAKGVDPARVAIVRDGAEPPNTSGEPSAFDQEVVRAIRGKARFVVLHAGNLGFYGAWETLLLGAKQFSADGIELVFVGEGAQKKRLQLAAQDTLNVRFLPFFPASKIPSVLAAADIHLITVRDGLEGVVVPSKMYDILSAGKPILAVAPASCDVVTLGQEKGFAAAADPKNPDVFADVVRALAQDQTLLQRMCEAARKAAPEYDRKKELGKLVGVIAEAKSEISNSSLR